MKNKLPEWDVKLEQDPFHIDNGEYAVWSVLYQRYFYGSTLELARTNRKIASERKINSEQHLTLATLGVTQ